MYLKSLTLKGFKSFADKSHMVFEPGLTVIVGPNGSGKSNVSDAIRWVLGEQSAKQLRGQAMEDVVFAGSSARKPVGMAEVDLTLDNSDHMLPVDFEEVVITRRMYRSGESEYLVNGSPARLLDITDILHDTGLGKETHSIIGQGKLDSILASKPEERRALIEEAAGISKHKRRRERSVKKLESMDRHLQRALDVQKEVSRQLKPLERQVERAKQAGELETRAKELRCILAVDDLRKLQVRWNAILRDEVECSTSLELAQARVEGKTAELDRLRILLEQKGLFAGDLTEQRGRCQSAVEKLEGEIRLLGEKDRGMATRISQLSALVEGDESRARQVLEETERTRVERDETLAALQELRRRADVAKSEVETARQSRRKAQEELDRAASSQRATQRERDACAVSLAKAQDAVKNAQVQDGIFVRRATQLEESIAEAQSELEAAILKKTSLDSEIDQAKADESAASEEVSDARGAVDAARSAASAAQRALASAEAKVNALRDALEQEENSAPLAAVLANDPSFSQCTARVNEVLDVPDELEGLVELLLRDDLDGFVVPSPKELVVLGRAAQSLASKSQGTVRIVCGEGAVDDDLMADIPGYRLLDRLSALPGYGHVAQACLGDVRVVDDVEAACAASAAYPGLRFATPDGAVASRGSVLGVSGASHGPGQGVLVRRRSLRELEQRLPELTAAADGTQHESDEAEGRLDGARKFLSEASSRLATLTGEMRSVSSEVMRLEQLLSRSRSELDAVTRQREEAKTSASKAFEDLDRQEVRLKSLGEKFEEEESFRVELEEAFERLRRDERRAHDEANDSQLELARVQERYASIDRGGDRLEREAEELSERIASSRTELSGLTARIRRVEPLRTTLAALLDSARSTYATLNDRASLAQADSAEIKATIDLAREEVSSAETSRARATTALNDVRVQKGRLEVQVDQAVKAITSQPGVILEDALELPAPLDRAADEREFHRLERQLAEIGPVNQVAFEEYAQLKERSDYLESQISDLQRARTDLHKILAAIDRKMRDGFLEAFDRVNANFGDVFGMLFPGGNGHLEMTDPDDPANTGIEVVAQPRGKKVAKMSLLSGGERSLAALGLLFAVYKTRSVPFYVLDEVEAALDDSNLDRLLGAMDQLRHDTQLIVISHQRRTMESADVLYGISMKADGVSQVVSQKLERK